jgi:hypothetical protein
LAFGRPCYSSIGQSRAAGLPKIQGRLLIRRVIFREATRENIETLRCNQATEGINTFCRSFGLILEGKRGIVGTIAEKICPENLFSKESCTIFTNFHKSATLASAHRHISVQK